MGRASRRRAAQRVRRQGEEQRRENERVRAAAARKAVAELFGDVARIPLTLVVDTPRGPFVRRIPHALPLPEGVEPGIGAEEATHQAAATWGMPDFVYRAAVRRLPSGQRELGDRLLIVGDRAAVVQVKSRQGTLRDDVGERSWTRKQANKAVRQANGTVRSLRAMPAEFTNGRGRKITVDGNRFTWLAVAVIDHQQLPADTSADVTPGGLPVVTLLRRDWDFLFNQLRSTYAVMQYLFRVSVMPGIPLGDEAVRYYDLAAADLDTPPSPVAAPWLGPGAQQRSTPLLPQTPAAFEDDRALVLLRIISEDIATSPMTGSAEETARLQALAEIDSLPVGFRVELGQVIQQMMDDVADRTDRLWRFRRLLDSGPLQLIFGACSQRAVCESLSGSAVT
jgi:hypothetical protein